jgi:hypothetical protein
MKGISPGPAVGDHACRLTEYVSCKVTAKTTAEWNRLFQRCAELALFIVASAQGCDRISATVAALHVPAAP